MSASSTATAAMSADSHSTSLDSAFGPSSLSTSASSLSSPLAAFARFGQYFSGASASPAAFSHSVLSTSASSTTSTLSDCVAASIVHLHAAAAAPNISYTADTALTAFSSDPVSSHAVVAGRGCMCIVRVDPDRIVETEAFPNFASDSRLGYVSDLKWAIGPYSRTVIVASTNGRISMHDIDRPAAPVSFLSGHSRVVNSLSINPFNPNMLISAGSDATLRYWDLRLGRCVTAIHGPDGSRRVQFSNVDGHHSHAIFDTGVLHRYDARNPSMPDRNIIAHSGQALCLDCHHTKDYVVTGGRDKQIRVWDLSSSDPVPKSVYSISTAGAISNVIWRPPSSTDKDSLDNAQLATSSLSVDDYRIQIWGLKRKFVPDRVIDHHRGPVQAIAWARDGPYGSLAPPDEPDSSDDLDLDYDASRRNSSRRRNRASRRRAGVIWACSRDTTFTAHDVARSCPRRAVRNLSHQAFAWGPNDEFAFLGIDRRTLDRDGFVVDRMQPKHTGSRMMRMLTLSSAKDAPEERHVPSPNIAYGDLTSLLGNPRFTRRESDSETESSQ
ncbi:WD40-repeat-containing domain protein [Limtongia smithiae]|uniref:WD40-repeat-containing domain protein n=1 Tax=Limtongia smithiae TaxID=1125753 RepID=UPI0034CEF21E